MNKPNILFLFADDQRFDTIRSLGNDEIITPNLDKLVKEGTAYTQAHIPCGTSGAVCMPSRAMLHTGRTLFHIQDEGQEISNEHTLLGETLQEAGYDTFGTGKWHNGVEAYARSFNSGDEIFFGGMDDHWSVPCHSFDPTRKYDGRINKVKNYMYSNKKDTFVADHIAGGKHSTELFTDATINYIKNRNTDKPFFAYVSYMAPHDPRTMPQQFLDMYDIDKISVPKNFQGYHHIEYDNTNCRDEILASYPRTEQETKEQLMEYYAMITHIDDEIGKLIDTLQREGELENTIIIFAADNGLALGQHGLFGKQCHYDHSIRVPFIISGSGIPKDKRCDDYIYLLDIFPTICDLVDVPIPETVEGLSFKNGIFDEPYNKRKDLYFAYTDKIRSVKDDEYKLMEVVYDGRITTQLFDLESDPLETSNLAGISEYESKVRFMRDKLKYLANEWDDESHRLGKAYWNAYREVTQKV